MAQFSQVGFVGPVGVISQVFGVISSFVLAEIIAGPTDWATITEIGFQPLGNGAGAWYGIGAPSAIGVGPQLGVWGSQPYDPSVLPSPIQLVTAWQKPPTVPTTYLRRMNAVGLQNANPMIFKFPRGLQLVNNQHLVLISSSAVNSKYLIGDIWVEWDN